MKDRYVYPAIFTHDEDGFAVEFPDLPGCVTCATSLEEAFDMAKNALGLHLFGMEQDGYPIPAPSYPSAASVRLEPNQTVALVEVWMPPVRGEAEAMRSVKKTLTLPRWLNDLGEKHRVNFSQILQEGLKAYLGVGATSGYKSQAENLDLSHEVQQVILQVVASAMQSREIRGKTE